MRPLDLPEEDLLKLFDDALKNNVFSDSFKYGLGRVDICGIMVICPHLPYPIRNGQK